MHKDGVMYQEEEFLQLSGLQHFKFCQRQWALIHIEKQWSENYRTTDGAMRIMEISQKVEEIF